MGGKNNRPYYNNPLGVNRPEVWNEALLARPLSKHPGKGGGGGGLAAW